tara:strand:- start:2287 stop:2490 length:204 start_codon:yes stop_codon:yes gene_type:complete
VSIGFGFDGNKKKQGIRINKEEINKVTKEYKKLKKYMKTNMYKIKDMSGKETIVSKLLDEYGGDFDG